MRLEQRLGTGREPRVALFNADAGTIGDDPSLDLPFRQGLLAIAEGGVERGGLKLVAGA